MTGDQSAVLGAHFSVAPGQVHHLGTYAPRGARIAQAARLAPLWEENFGLHAHDFVEETDILDPFGASFEAYEACAAQIRRCVFELARVVSGLK